MNQSAPITNNDQREALWNDRPVGIASLIQVPEERITTPHGILFDLDPKLYIPGNLLFPPDADPVTFYNNMRGVLARHPLARHAEVRVSGTGLHIIVRLEPAVEMTTAGQQERWKHVVRVVQSTLPIDLEAPGITALTRPVDSINSKNGATVTVVKEAEPLPPAAVEEYLQQLVCAPFKEIAIPLLGGLRRSPCPVCPGPDTRLDVTDHVGMCYNGCGKVTIGQLFDVIYRPELPGKGAKPIQPGQRECMEGVAMAA
jgi:hypothetical protein